MGWLQRIFGQHSEPEPPLHAPPIDTRGDGSGELTSADDFLARLERSEDLEGALDEAAVEERAAGMVGGRHFLDWGEKVQRLKREQKLDEALALVMRIIEASERQQAVEASHAELRARALGGDRKQYIPRETPPGWTHQAAIILRKLGRYEDEVAVIDRWEAHAGSPDRWVGATHRKLLERREKAAQLAEAARLDPGSRTAKKSASRPESAKEPKPKELKPQVRMTMASPEMLEQEPAEAYRELRELIDAEPNPARSWYLRWWAADTLTLLQDYVRAAREYPEALGGRAVMQIERLWSLKVAAEMSVMASEVLAFLGPKVTSFGRQHLHEVQQAMEALLEQDQGSDAWPSLREWAETAPQDPYQVFIGSSAGYRASQEVTIQHYRFGQAPEVVSACADLMRRAENEVRRASGVPFVGEGWVAETSLYRQVQAAFPDKDVIQHGSPDWLGRQHLDVWIPDLRVALEYQGVQHDQPVDYFGGEEGLAATHLRDERKRRLCNANSVRLIEVRPGYDLIEVLTQIGQSGPVESEVRGQD